MDSRVSYDSISFDADQTHFLLLTCRYRINGKSYTQEAKVSPFALLQQQPGEFTITSVAHQQKMCKAAVTDLRFTVHPLPAARIGHGDRIYEDIHEGALHALLLCIFADITSSLRR